MELLEKGVEKKALFKKVGEVNKKELENLLRGLYELHTIEKKSKKIKKEYFRKFDRQFYYLSALEKKDLERYKIQERIKKIKVAILGVGSTGQWVIPALIESGFRKFKIVDFDNVEEKNLLAQILFSRKDIGKRKIDSVYSKMKDMEPRIEIERVNKKLETEKDVKRVIRGCDIVAHCCDLPRFKIHQIITKACIKLKIPNIIIESGKVGPFNIPRKTPCFFCLEKQIKEIFPEYDTLVTKLADTPTRRYPGLPAICSLMGVMGAKEILLHIINKAPPVTYTHLLVWDPITGDVLKKELKTNKICNICGYKKNN
ncbi:MAG: ThiF family adenylyltransferase [Candidatus Pacearchaeota archaeon]|nr:ThiF family adenylyltransferase [Candidatus Pacearchaeota archaeon]